jgi:hypothetical protein
MKKNKKITPKELKDLVKKNTNILGTIQEVTRFET